MNNVLYLLIIEAQADEYTKTNDTLFMNTCLHFVYSKLSSGKKNKCFVKQREKLVQL